MNAWMLLIAAAILIAAGAIVAMAAGLVVMLLRAMFRPSAPPAGAPRTPVSDWDDDDEIAARHHLHDL